MAWLMAPAAATITGTCEMDGAVSATPLRFSRGNCQAFLQTVQGTIELNGLIATVSANFTYKNEKKSIEAAVLSLPMPKQAILQGYELQDRSRLRVKGGEEVILRMEYLLVLQARQRAAERRDVSFGHVLELPMAFPSKGRGAGSPDAVQLQLFFGGAWTVQSGTPAVELQPEPMEAQKLMKPGELDFSVPDATLPAQPFMLSLQRHGASQRLAAQVWVPPNISMCQGLPNAVPGMTDLEIEFFFVVDPSVTMRGPRLAKVRQALRVLLRSLPNAAVVNVVGLSSQSSADALFPESRPLNSQTFDAVDEFLKRDAEEFLDSVTGLHSLLSTVFDTRRDSSQLRVALITDRYPPDQKASVQLLEESCDANCRVFVLGLGWGASPLFVEQASKVGHGSYAYVAERDVSYGIEKNLLAQMVDAGFVLGERRESIHVSSDFPLRNASKLVGEELVEVEAFEEDVKNRGLAMAILGEVPGDLASAALGTLSIEVSLGTQTFHATATPPSGPIMVGSSLHAVVARQMVQEGRAPSAAWAASLGIPSGSFQWNSVDRAGRSTPLRCEEKVEKVERLQPELSTREKLTTAPPEPTTSSSTLSACEQISQKLSSLHFKSLGKSLSLHQSKSWTSASPQLPSTSKPRGWTHPEASPPSLPEMGDWAPQLSLRNFVRTGSAFSVQAPSMLEALGLGGSRFSPCRYLHNLPMGAPRGCQPSARLSMLDFTQLGARLSFHSAPQSLRSQWDSEDRRFSRLPPLSLYDAARLNPAAARSVVAVSTREKVKVKPSFWEHLAIKGVKALSSRLSLRRPALPRALERLPTLPRADPKLLLRRGQSLGVLAPGTAPHTLKLQVSEKCQVTLEEEGEVLLTLGTHIRQQEDRRHVPRPDLNDPDTCAEDDAFATKLAALAARRQERRQGMAVMARRPGARVEVVSGVVLAAQRFPGFFLFDKASAEEAKLNWEHLQLLSAHCKSEEVAHTLVALTVLDQDPIWRLLTLRAHAWLRMQPRGGASHSECHELAEVMVLQTSCDGRTAEPRVRSRASGRSCDRSSLSPPRVLRGSSKMPLRARFRARRNWSQPPWRNASPQRPCSRPPESMRHGAWTPTIAILEILAQYSNFRVATTEIQRLLDEAIIDVHEAAQLYDHVLRGLLNAQHPLTADRANLVIKEMLETQLQPTGDTLHLVVQAQTLYAAPGFLIDLGQMLGSVFAVRILTSSAVLEISNAHLRSGDLDAAYRWFVASQLMPERPPLQDPGTGRSRCTALSDGREPHTLSLLSQLARALAIAGHALALKRLLQCVLEGDTTLPPETAAVALSGSTCGRTLCTCWLEPSAELLRRRSTWASDVQMKPLSVTVADQWDAGRNRSSQNHFKILQELVARLATRSTGGLAWLGGFAQFAKFAEDWKRQESSRHEKYQWYPYLAPDTRLGRNTGPNPRVQWTLERAWLTPLRSMDHGALGLQAQWGGQTPAQAAARERLGSDAEAFDLPSAEALLAEKSTQIMMGTKPVTFAFRHSEIKEWLDGAEPGLIAHLAQQDLKSLGREELDELFQEP
eukprot:g23933.t1